MADASQLECLPSVVTSVAARYNLNVNDPENGRYSSIERNS